MIPIQLILYPVLPIYNKKISECAYAEISTKNSPHDDVRQIFCNLYRSVRAQSNRPRNQRDVK